MVRPTPLRLSINNIWREKIVRKNPDHVTVKQPMGEQTVICRDAVRMSRERARRSKEDGGGRRGRGEGRGMVHHLARRYISSRIAAFTAAAYCCAVRVWRQVSHTDTSSRREAKTRSQHLKHSLRPFVQLTPPRSSVIMVSRHVEVKLCNRGKQVFVSEASWWVQIRWLVISWFCRWPLNGDQIAR